MNDSDYRLMSDDAILQALGQRLARHRLNGNRTQSAVAREAGVARRTVSKVENGHVVDSRSLLRILRALDLLDGLDTLVPLPRTSPVALAKSQGKQRQRARCARDRAGADETDTAEWTWPDQP